MSVSKYDKDTGELVTLANGSRIWCGTKAAKAAAIAAGTMPNNCMVCVTDDYPDNEGDITDTVSITEIYKSYVTNLGVFRDGRMVYVHFRFTPTGNYNTGYSVLMHGLPKCTANDGIQCKPYTMTETVTVSPTIYAYSRASSGDLLAVWDSADKDKIWVFDFVYYTED